MTKKQLQASLKDWKARLVYRTDHLAQARKDGHLDGLVTHAEADRIKKWEARYREAKDRVTRREQQLAKAATVGEPPATLKLSPNRSSRGGVAPRIVVLHSTEGTYESAVAWLADRRAQASSHVVVSREGASTRLVPDEDKAWTQAAFNPQALSVEQEGYASQASWPVAQLEATARWIAYWSNKYNIPIQHSLTSGVCLHSDLGVSGGGHHDPGTAYPVARVLSMARTFV